MEQNYQLLVTVINESFSQCYKSTHDALLRKKHQGVLLCNHYLITMLPSPLKKSSRNKQFFMIYCKQQNTSLPKD